MPISFNHFKEKEEKLIEQCVDSKMTTYDLSIVREYLKEKGILNLIPFEEAIKEWDID